MWIWYVIVINFYKKFREIDISILKEFSSIENLIKHFSGLSGEVLDEQGHFWIGMDISPSMLKIADEREVEGDLVLGDMGDGLPFKAGE